MSKILAGYRFIFNSSDIKNENDKTIIKEGLTEEEANLFAEISEYIQGGTYLELRSSTPEWRIKKEHERLYDILQKHSNLFSTEKMKSFKDDVGLIIDYISENMLGYSYDENFDMRTLNSYSIEYVPQEIIIEDVTHSFIKNKI